MKNNILNPDMYYYIGSIVLSSFQECKCGNKTKTMHICAERSECDPLCNMSQWCIKCVKDVKKEDSLGKFIKRSPFFFKKKGTLPELVWTDVEFLKEDKMYRLSVESLVFFRNKDAMTNWEMNFYMNILRYKDLSEKQSSILVKINKSVLFIVEYLG